MAQIFHRSANSIARFSLLFAVLAVTLGLTGILMFARAPYYTRQNIVRDQPIQFSHKHHAGDDGICCHYCHSGMETSAQSGIPPTNTCMNCLAESFKDAAFLEPVLD